MTDGITLGIALLGATLGILNTWRAFDRDRIRLKVTPISYHASNGAHGFGVEIINTGYLPLSIREISLSTRWDDRFIPSFRIGSLHGDDHLPVRLEARTAITAYFAVGTEEHEKFHRVRCVRVTTACGRRFKGTNPMLKRFVAHLRAARKSIKKAR